MRVRSYLIGLASIILAACNPSSPKPTGCSLPDNGWLFLGNAPYTLNTRVEAAPGPASFCLVTDLSLMGEPEVVFSADATGAEDAASLSENHSRAFSAASRNFW